MARPIWSIRIVFSSVRTQSGHAFAARIISSAPRCLPRRVCDGKGHRIARGGRTHIEIPCLSLGQIGGDTREWSMRTELGTVLASTRCVLLNARLYSWRFAQFIRPSTVLQIHNVVRQCAGLALIHIVKKSSSVIGAGLLAVVVVH